MTTRTVAVLGSTGSIGTQALDVVRAHPGRFEVVALSAGGNTDLLVRQAVELGVPLVAAARGTTDGLRSALRGAAEESKLHGPQGFGRSTNTLRTTMHDFLEMGGKGECPHRGRDGG